MVRGSFDHLINIYFKFNAMRNLFVGRIMPLLCLLAWMLMACEQPLMTPDEEAVEDSSVEVDDETEHTLKVYVNNLESRCTRLNYVLFQNGNKLKTFTQKRTDSDFGHKSFDLAPGTYQLLLLAYDGDSNPTISSPEKITFGNKSPGMSDVLYAYQELTVTEEASTLYIPLRWASSTFQLHSTDDVPSWVRSIRIYYTGGSSTLSALTGMGNANSRQEVIFDINDSHTGSPLLLEVYSFPRSDRNIKMQITVSNDSQVLLERQYDDIRLSPGSLLRYEGRFFGETQEEMQKIYLSPFE